MLAVLTHCKTLCTPGINVSDYGSKVSKEREAISQIGFGGRVSCTAKQKEKVGVSFCASGLCCAAGAHVVVTVAF